MFAAVLAQHLPLIRDYPGAPPAPPAPPDPPAPPQPPLAEPIAFGAVARAGLFGIIGTAISSTTMATITCADAAMTIVLSEAVAGLTFSYAGGVLTVAGTPTGSTRRQRVVVSYIASDGSSSVRGSTSHEITLVDESEVLTIGPMANVTGRVGIPLTAVLATPSSNYAVDLTAYAQSLVGGRTFVNVVNGLRAFLAWTRGGSSGSGVLTLSGTPSEAGTYSLVVNFYAPGGRVVGTSTHSVVIAEAYQATPPAPAPTPSPDPVTPTVPANPAPAPVPGVGPDNTLDNLRLLMRFNTDEGIGRNERGGELINSGATLAAGAVGQCAQFSSATANISGIVPGLHGVGAGLSVECMADISESAWDALTVGGDDQRFCPVVSYTAEDGRLLWALGFLSRIVDSGVVGQPLYRRVQAMFWTSLDDAYSLSGSGASSLGGITTRPGTFVHVAGVLKTYGASTWERASWLGGAFCLSRVQVLQATASEKPTGLLKIGGACAVFRTYDRQYAPVTIVPFGGKIDELRIKAPGQYADLMNLSDPAAIPLTRRVIPWPNY